MPYTVLVINPGSTSTKIAVFENDKELFSENVTHSADEIAAFPSIASQYAFREKHLRDALARKGFDIKQLSCIVGRGGLLKPIPGGVYQVNEAMKAELLDARNGEHASNLGALIADALAKEAGVPAFIADPVVVDELDELARIYGHAMFTKRSIFHALNQKAVAKRWCRENKRNYAEVNVIVAHMGGGVSVGLHRSGRVVDVNNALNGEGPFSPERAGTLPAGDLAKLCFSGKYSEKEVLKMITGQGGMVSLYGTNDMRVLENAYKKDNDPKAELIYKAFLYNMGKAIGALATAARGKVDAIILTGGIAYGPEVQETLRDMCAWVAPVTVYPGEGELEALALAGVGALSGEAAIQEYK